MSGRRLLRVAWLALALFGTVCAGAAAQNDSAAVRGRITDAAGSPLLDFPVLVLDSGGRAVTLRTGRDGRFQTIGLSAGAVTVQLNAQGYAQVGVRCRVPAGLTAYFELSAARTAHGPLPAPRCRIEPPTSDLYIIE
ncbi:MAG: carboxypeptidase-like regulatory domain-containing protein [Candidatus Eremiobacteraeota bacterium]|nr:carboxypeptidase-like regulatory domain-containing protein [Candidatus Eremiobacteraeota bacterium]